MGIEWLIKVQMDSVFISLSLYFSFLKCDMVKETNEDLDLYISPVLNSYFFKSGHLCCLSMGVRNGAVYSILLPRPIAPHQGVVERYVSSLLWVEKCKPLLLDKSMCDGLKSNAFVSKWLAFALDLSGGEKI